MKYKAKKSLGQNFLRDVNMQKKIADAALKTNAKTLVEIGPGQGALTQHLAQSKKPLILIEKDHELAAELKKNYQDDSHVQVIQSDFLDLDFSLLPQDQISFVGNLPYNVASQIMIKIFHSSVSWLNACFLVQKEMALRCVSKKNSKDYGVLTVQCELFSVAEKLFDVSPTVFWPQPKVWSSVVRFEKKHDVNFGDHQSFIRFVRSIFTQRRKMLRSILKSQFSFVAPENFALMTQLEQRPEDFSLKELQNFYAVLLEAGLKMRS